MASEVQCVRPPFGTAVRRRAEHHAFANETVSIEVKRMNGWNADSRKQLLVPSRFNYRLLDLRFRIIQEPHSLLTRIDGVFDMAFNLC
jgi:hypothetical protein